MKNICTVAVILCALLSLCACNKAENKNTVVTVATVNGESVTNDEFQYFKGKLKAQVLNDYLQKYHVEYSAGFWSRKFDGKTPEQALNEQALEKCVTAKMQFILMKKKGIYTDISYQGLYNKAIAFNEANSNKAGVVGLKSIKMSQFYSYYLDNGVMELKNILAKDEIKPSEKEISGRAALLKASKKYTAETDLKSIASAQLIAEKYDQYIAGLRKAADVKIIDTAQK